MVSMEEAKDSHPDSSRLIDRSAAWARSVNTCASFRPNLRLVAVACLAYLNTYRYVLARLFPSPLSPQLARIAAYIRRRYVRACVLIRTSTAYSRETRPASRVVFLFQVSNLWRIASVRKIVDLEISFLFRRSSTVQLDKSIDCTVGKVKKRKRRTKMS